MAIVPSGVSVPAQSKELDNTTVTTSYGLVYRQVITLAEFNELNEELDKIHGNN